MRSARMSDHALRNVVSGRLAPSGRFRLAWLVFACVAVAALVIPMYSHAAAGDTARVSVASNGSQATGGDSDAPIISADGMYVTFFSASVDLVPGDTNGVEDCFVHDRQTGMTERVSVASDGGQAGGASTDPSISGDGRYVAFHSYATTLVAGDTNGAADIFVRDRETSTTVRVSVTTSGTQTAAGDSLYPAISDDGRYVAFVSEATTLVAGDTNGVRDVFVHDRQTGATERVSVASDGSQANGWSSAVAISADGQRVTYHSAATDLVAGDTNGVWDIFVRDREASSTVRASVASGGGQAFGASEYPAISADGRYVAFRSVATTLVRR